jgi:hypothetical protein
MSVKSLKYVPTHGKVTGPRTSTTVPDACNTDATSKFNCSKDLTICACPPNQRAVLEIKKRKTDELKNIDGDIFCKVCVKRISQIEFGVCLDVTPVVLVFSLLQRCPCSTPICDLCCS